MAWKNGLSMCNSVKESLLISFITFSSKIKGIVLDVLDFRSKQTYRVSSHVLIEQGAMFEEIKS